MNIDMGFVVAMLTIMLGAYYCVFLPFQERWKGGLTKLWNSREVISNTLNKFKKLKGSDGMQKIYTLPAPHIMIIGQTGSGKTTLAKAIIAHRLSLGGKLVVIDPHARRSDWRNTKVWGMGRNFREIRAILASLQAELTYRYNARAEDDVEDFPEISIYIDEVPAISDKLDKEWGKFVTEVATEGRKVNMRLIVMSHSTLVEMFGIKGKSDLLLNFSELSIGNQAHKAGKKAGVEVSKGMRHPCILEHAGSAILINVFGAHKVKMPDIDEWVPGSTHPVMMEETVPKFSVEDVLKCAFILNREPGINTRQLALKLGYGDGRGSYHERATALRAEVVEVLGRLKST